VPTQIALRRWASAMVTTIAVMDPTRLIVPLP